MGGDVVRPPVNDVPTFPPRRQCVVCGCTDNDCRQCIAKMGRPCSWISMEPPTCSACGILDENGTPQIRGTLGAGAAEIREQLDAIVMTATIPGDDVFARVSTDLEARMGYHRHALQVLAVAFSDLAEAHVCSTMLEHDDGAVPVVRWAPGPGAPPPRPRGPGRRRCRRARRVTVDGGRALRCTGCGCLGPIRAKAKDARAAAKAERWVRSYPRGRGEDFYCPDCRAR